MTVPPITVDSLSPLILAQEGLRYGNYMKMASASLVVYDYLISLSREVSLFWSCPMSLSKVLYMITRYLSLFIVLEQAVSYPSHKYSVTLGTALLSFILNIVFAALCQAVVTIRVWYLFEAERTIRLVVIAFYAICTIGSAICLAFLSHGLLDEALGVTILGETPSTPGLWWLFVPSVILHTAIFALTLWKTRNIGSPQESSIKRLLQEGFFVYVFVSAVYILEIIGLLPTGSDQRYLPMAILLGQLQTAVIIVVTCRTLINLRSLSDTLDIDPSWLLNATELSRVRCYEEQRGELVVETTPMSPIAPLWISNNGMDTDSDVRSSALTHTCYSLIATSSCCQAAARLTRLLRSRMFGRLRAAHVAEGGAEACTRNLSQYASIVDLVMRGTCSTTRSSFQYCHVPPHSQSRLVQPPYTCCSSRLRATRVR